MLERVLEKEQAMFGNDYSDNVYTKGSSVLYDLRSDKKWEEHWLFFLEQMVYQSEKPGFEQAIAAVEELNN